MMSLGNREGRATMKQSRKTYRISYAGALMARATASCDGQDGRLFLRAYTVICVILGEWK